MSTITPILPAGCAQIFGCLHTTENPEGAGASAARHAVAATVVIRDRPRRVSSPPICHRATSSGAARASAAWEASSRSGLAWASSVKRAAWFTGSPITVDSNRFAAPMLPATTRPAHADAGTDHVELARQTRPQRAPGGERPRRGVLIGQRRTEYAQRGVALELVHPAIVSGHNVDHDGEECVQHGDDLRRVTVLGQRRRTLETDEQHRGLAGFAAQRDTVLQRVTNNVLTDLTAEKIA